MDNIVEANSASLRRNKLRVEINIHPIEDLA
jgi:hypothetical protein